MMEIKEIRERNNLQAAVEEKIRNRRNEKVIKKEEKEER